MATDFALRAALEAILTVAETPLNLVTLAGALEVPIAQVKQEWLRSGSGRLCLLKPERELFLV